MAHPNLELTISSHLIEPEAWSQIMNTLNIECLVKLAIMPDVHAGYDLPIGGVALLQDHIWPGAVGYDIGCGMCHINTHNTLEELNLVTQENRQKLFRKILEMIPVGFNSREKNMHIPEKCPTFSGDKQTAKKVEAKMFKQLGTLGGGNHFIEIGVNSKNEVGITIHSGSRNPGHTIGGFYMDLAKKEGIKFGKGTGMFKLDSDLGQQYYASMEWAENYALQNRKIMIQEILDCLDLNIKDFELINENHNHAIPQENSQVLHRKGATQANTEQLGVIPSNQRDGVYITKGLGNTKFLESASHGAGRCMSRKKAKQQIDIDLFKSQMEGIVCSTNEKVLDEAPDAYKNIQDIISMQDGLLVDVFDHFKPIIVVKG